MDETKNMQLDEQAIKLRNFELVSDALNAKPVENVSIIKFERLINEDFIKFCDNEPGGNDAKPLQKLQDVLKELRLIANCPPLYSRNIGAVGGGFSAGKSAFLNSFLINSKVRLSEGIRPVTAIPSYVICDDNAKVTGITYKGCCFEIAIDMFKAISHEFLKSFKFNLNEIILYTTVLVPMEEHLFGNICLIDTPGYNPPSSGSAEHDFETAKEYIKDAQFLIWIVGLDSNGTIPRSDLDFLDRIGFRENETLSLYIVANKAELKNKDDIDSILDKFQDCLDDNDLSYVGICAYSSKTKKVYAERKIGIHDFLKSHNKPNQKHEELFKTIRTIFSEYTKHIENDDAEKKSKRSQVKELLLKALRDLRLSIDESNSKLEKSLNSLEQYFVPAQPKEDRIKRAEDLREKFIECLRQFCKDMGIEYNKPTPTVYNKTAIDVPANLTETNNGYWDKSQSKWMARTNLTANGNGYWDNRQSKWVEYAPNQLCHDNVSDDIFAGKMMLVKGGTFTMGATPEQGDDSCGDELPAHKVTLGDFYMGIYPVTQEQWVKIMGNNPSEFEGGNLPVESVSWNDVQLFIQKLNKMTGKNYQLPTEAEWEYAARGGNQSRGYKYSGSNDVNEVAWYRENSRSTHPVGTRIPNELGLYDMSGNVNEWCNDWYRCGYYGNSSQNPIGPTSGSHRVMRGGSFCCARFPARVSYRDMVSPHYGFNNVGFRLVRH
jgi:formylglycine-generating enzyme required for sulfatase activity